MDGDEPSLRAWLADRQARGLLDPGHTEATLRLWEELGAGLGADLAEPCEALAVEEAVVLRWRGSRYEASVEVRADGTVGWTWSDAEAGEHAGSAEGATASHLTRHALAHLRLVCGEVLASQAAAKRPSHRPRTG
jgi:hypothetical protein